MNLRDLKCCPFCGGQEYYIVQHVVGDHRCVERFDGKPAENWEGATEEIWSDKRIRCYSCNKYLADYPSGDISRGAQKALMKSVSIKAERGGDV